jgi:broad specificity phosphatase PhoE
VCLDGDGGSVDARRTEDGMVRASHAASHGAFIRILLCEFVGLDPRLYVRLKIDNCHAALLKFYAEPPHQLVGLNLAPR